MRTLILLVSVDNTDARKICENFQGHKFDIGGSVQATDYDVRNKLIEELKGYYDTEVLDFPIEDIEVWNLNDFMDYNNDEEYNPDNYFMGYIFA
jgi:hypothetical protein